MAKAKFKPGDVVWATVPDRSGNVKSRPNLVIHPGAVNRQQPLVCLAISTDLSNNEDDPTISLPWDAGAGSSTGLKRPCVVVLLWRILVEQDRATPCGAISQALLATIIDARERAMARQKSS